MMHFRSYLAIALALLIGLTSQQLALMRGQPQASGEVILCTGTGPVSIAVGTDGQPTGPAHICPDCAMTMMVALATPMPEVSRVVQISSLVFEAVDAVETYVVHIPHSARGPPLFV